MKTSLVILLCAGLLSGCGGGGGGSGGASPQVPGPDVMPLQYNQTYTSARTVTLSGINQSVTGPTEDSQFSGRINTNSSGIVTSFTVDSPSTGFSATLPFVSESSGIASFGSADQTTAAVAVDPAAIGWQYQTWGYWIQDTFDTNHNLTNVRAQGFSIGAETPTNDMPTTGTATYTGIAGGFLIPAGGNASNAYATAARVGASADFGARTLTVSTTSTTIEPVSGGAAVAHPELDFSGNLAISGNGFSGSAANGGHSLSGNVLGKFYGPHADEIGGAYNLQGSAGQLVGAFGAKK